MQVSNFEPAEDQALLLRLSDVHDVIDNNIGASSTGPNPGQDAVEPRTNSSAVDFLTAGRSHVPWDPSTDPRPVPSTRIWSDGEKEFTDEVFTVLEQYNRRLCPKSPLAGVVRFYQNKGWPPCKDLSEQMDNAWQEAAQTKGRKLQMFVICDLQSPAEEGKVCCVTATLLVPRGVLM